MNDILTLVAENLSMFLLAGLGVFFLIHFLFGLIFLRLRKSIYRFICFIIFVVALFLCADYLMTFLFNFDISFIYGMVQLPEFIQGNTITEIVSNLEITFLGAANDTTTTYLLGVVSVLIKFVYILVLSIVLYIVYSLIMGIIYAIFFSGRAKDRRKRREGERVRKHKFMGGIVNGLKGCLLYCLILTVLLNGPLGCIDTSILKVEEDDNNLSQLVFMDDNELVHQIIDIVDAYKESPFFSILEETKIDEENNISINDYINGMIFSFKLDENTTVNLRDEFKNIMSVAGDGLKVYQSVMNPSGAIDFESAKNVFYALGDSQFISTLLPIGVSVATQLEQVTTILNQYNVDASTLTNINWSNDIKKIGDLCLDAGNLLSTIKVVSGSDGGVMNIDFTSIEEENINALFTTLSDMTLLNTLMGTAVDFALTLPAVQQYLGETTLDIADIVWKDEIVNIGDLVASVLNLGVKSANELLSNPLGIVDKLDFGDVDDETDYGKTGALFDAIFASSFVSKVLPTIMENVVLPLIPEAYRDLFDFTDINETGWNNEFNYLLGIFKDVKSDPETKIFNEDGTINLGIIANVKPVKLLNSSLIRNALYKTLKGVKNGEGALASLASTIKIPDKLNTDTSSAWMNLDINYYVAKENFIDNETSYKQYQRINTDVYETLSEDNKLKCSISYKCIGGELYNILNGVTELLDVVDLTSLTDPTSLLSATTVNKLVGPSNSDASKTKIEQLLESDILRATLSGLVSTMATGMIVFPVSVIDDDCVVTENENEIKVISKQELGTIVKAIAKSGLIGDSGLNLNLGLGMISTLTDVVDIDTGKTKLDYLLDSETLHYTLSKLLTDNVGELLDIPSIAKENGIIKTSELNNAITAINKLGIIDESGNFGQVDLSLITGLTDPIEGDNKTKLDYCLDSYIIRATLSSKITLVGEMIKVPAGEGGVKVVLDDGDETTTDAQVITEEELINLVTAINKLGIIENGELKFSLKLVNDLLDEVDNKTKLSYLLDSKILHATICDLLTGLDGVLQIPSTSYANIGDIQCINKQELTNLITGIVKMNAISDTGNINFSLGMIADLPNIIPSENKSKLDYALSSDILHSTISNFITGMELFTIPSDANLEETIGDKKVITGTELNYLLTGIGKSGFINGEELSFDLAMIPKLTEKVEGDTRSKLDYMLDSKILHIFLANAMDFGAFVIPLQAKETIGDSLYISGTELFNMLDAFNAANINLEDIDFAGFLSADETGKTKIADSLILRTMISTLLPIPAAVDAIDNEILCYKNESGDIIDAETPGYDRVIILTSNEVKAILSAFNALGFESLDDMDFSVDTFTNLTDEQLDIVLSSKCIHQMMSETMIDTLNSSGLLSYTDTDACIVTALINNVEYPLSYAKANKLNDEEKEQRAYVNSSDYTRLTVEEIKAILGFVKDPELLTNMMKGGEDSRNAADILTKSVLITYSLGDLLISNLDGNENLGSIASCINFITENDLSLWRDFANFDNEYCYEGNYVNDDQLYRLLNGLTVASDVATTIADGDITNLKKSQLVELDSIYMLRDALSSLAYYIYNSDIQDYDDPSVTHVAGEVVIATSTTGASVIAQELVVSVSYEPDVDSTDRLEFIDNFCLCLGINE